MKLAKNHHTEISQNDILLMSKFVVTENFNHHSNEILPGHYQNDIDAVYKEEMGFLENSKIFAFKNDLGDLIGTIRVLKWDFITPLPIQKMFGINPFICAEGNAINEIWHIGRFAIKKGVRDVNLLKKLLVCAIAPVCQHKDNMAFAEIDAKLLRVLTLMGIKAKVVGKSIEYLGSETIPVSMSYAGLIDFYNENKDLVTPEDFELSTPNSKLPNKVVFDANKLNYTLV
ncbi:hypothetical protein Flavo103_41220 [Flavobacterium collinsii]|uniref:hypothetical protein n=1 Tax=Flavobacterium collinsii TaxID=1114861 RepID=UPI0022C8FADF|nr:hypothetical protein [Flavobacterium collinsii]GIQ60986.1 hypothetical protein Flavo103_41220 [Flavobacterium collinsii]